MRIWFSFSFPAALLPPAGRGAFEVKAQPQVTPRIVHLPTSRPCPVCARASMTTNLRCGSDRPLNDH